MCQYRFESGSFSTLLRLARPLYRDVGKSGSIRLVRDQESVGSNPTIPTDTEGQANWRWHPSRTRTRPMKPLRVRLPLLPLTCPRGAEECSPPSQGGDRGFESRRGYCDEWPSGGSW